MTVKRPTYIPARMDWFPGEPLANRQITIREAVAPDVHQIRVLLSASASQSFYPEARCPSRKTIYRWLGQADYTVSLCVRNARTAVGICVSEQSPSGVRILHLYVAPEYSSFPIDERLILLASLELPERPTQIQLHASDEVRANRLRDLGWRCVQSQDDEGERTFEYRFLRREDRDGRGEDASS